MGGYTKIPKLSVGDLGSEGEGDRIALFNEEGDLVGWKPNAESGGNINNSYSTTEALTGGTWIDGKPIYRKFMNFISTEVAFSYDLSSLDIDTILPIQGMAKETGDTVYFNLNMSNNINQYNLSFISYYDYSSSEILFKGKYENWVPSEESSGIKDIEGYAILEYTKTTDPTP